MFSELQALRATTCLSSGFTTTVINIIIRAGTIFCNILSQYHSSSLFPNEYWHGIFSTEPDLHSLSQVVCNRPLFEIRTHILIQILHIGYFISPTFSKDTGRMGRKNYLAIFIQPSKCIKQLLLPTNM